MDQQGISGIKKYSATSISKHGFIEKRGERTCRLSAEQRFIGISRFTGSIMTVHAAPLH
jgi:hypothetical protein